jgi:hypothetical protein
MLGDPVPALVVRLLVLLVMIVRNAHRVGCLSRARTPGSAAEARPSVTGSVRGEDAAEASHLHLLSDRPL